MNGGSVLVECRGVSAGYGSTPVCRNLDLQVRSGEVVSLMGANGAGKTTTLLTIAGELAPLAGEIAMFGTTTKAPLHKLAKAGLSFVTEERSVIMDLSAADNLRLAGVPATRALEMFPELELLMSRTAGLLSGGQQQMLTLARALGRRPRLLIADELSLGLAPLVVERLLGVVRRAADEHGVGVLLVEQHVRQALAVADRVYVMQRGQLTMSGPAAEIGADLESIEAAYLSSATTV